jgi:hypothetical protein
MTPRHNHRDARLALFAVALLVCLVGCRPAWQATLVAPDGSPHVVDRDVLERLDHLTEEVDGRDAVPLEHVLYDAGHHVVDRLVVVQPDGQRQVFEWAAVADQDAWWLPDGSLRIVGETLPVARVEVQAPALLDQVQASIVDIAPTLAAALGMPAPSQGTGHAMAAPPADRVLLLFLDGFGYVRYEEALASGSIPSIASLGEPLVGLTTYPPVTSVSTASLLTGAPPAVHGAERRGIRKTETETLFDVAAAAGRQVVAVEGEALPFNLRNAQVRLSGDRDGDGSTDDNVLANALAVLEEGMPDLFYVHFHGIDDAGHDYGPGAPGEEAAVAEVDAAVGELIAALPADTLVIVFADHGMHAVNEEGRLGNHGHMIERDMFIPVFITSK